MYVPCGKCTACLLARKGNWVRRINMELYSLSSAYNPVEILRELGSLLVTIGLSIFPVANMVNNMVGLIIIV